MTPKQLEILQHTVGADRYGNPPKYGGRNHFCAGVADEPTCRELVALGFMVQHETTQAYPYFNCSATDAGKKAMREASLKAPKQSRSAKRFEEFRDARDAFGCTFREWLDMRKTDWYKDMKGSS